MFLLKEFQDLMAVALPVIVKLGILYLILRFTFAVSNVLVRLSALNSPPPAPAEESAPAIDISAAKEAVAALGEGTPEGEASQAAEPLPEGTVED